jgi:hypothetical protein
MPDGMTLPTSVRVGAAMRGVVGAVIGCALFGAVPVQAADLPVKARPVAAKSFDWSG